MASGLGDYVAVAVARLFRGGDFPPPNANIPASEDAGYNNFPSPTEG
jgi:hypothetical protein